MWEKINWGTLDMTVDNGVNESVVGEDIFMSMEINEDPISRRGIKYEVIHGVEVRTLAENKS